MASRSTASKRAGWRRVEPLELSPILAGALDVFYERGYHGASVRDIAKRVGVTVPALYYHHANKEAMLVALLETAANDALQRARAALEDAGDRPADQFANLIEALVLYMTHRTGTAYLHAEGRYVAPERRAGYTAMRKQLQQMVVDVVRRGVDDGVFDVPQVTDTVRAVLGMCQSIPTWYRPEGQLSAETVAKRYVEIALNTVRAGR